MIGASFLEGVVSTTVDTRVYPLETIRKTCHKFTARHYLHAQFIDEYLVEVSFKSKSADHRAEDIAGAFMNDLLDESLRFQVASDTDEIRNLILAHALSDTCLFRPELEESDPREDPLDIGRPDGVR